MLQDEVKKVATDQIKWGFVVQGDGQDLNSIEIHEAKILPRI